MTGKRVGETLLIIQKEFKNLNIKKIRSGKKVYFWGGGNMTLSKKPGLFLPSGWPAYFEKTKGCEVWDLEKNKFYDLSLMGVGTNTLSYSNPEVDSKVKSIIKKGNMSTLNCPEEVLLAEKIIELHPWAKK